MTTLTLIRGLPGSGKSTYAKNNYPAAAHYEADMFFLTDWNEYIYDRSLISAAHDWCFGNTAQALKNGHDVVVSNTFCAEWEMEKYFWLAPLVNAELEIVEMQTQYGSIHNVPDEAVVRMRDRWYKLPEGFNVKIIE